jgi:argininosuccinate lyase
MGLLMVVKGLALAYAKDLQEDKEPVFAGADALELSIAAMAAIISDIKVDKKAMRAAAEKGYPTATDLADWIVTNLNKPFREAHNIAGKAVARAEKRGLALDALSLEELQKIEPEITKSVYKVLSLDASVNARTSLGGTAPVRVKQQIAFWKERLK